MVLCSRPGVLTRFDHSIHILSEANNLTNNVVESWPIAVRFTHVTFPAPAEKQPPIFSYRRRDSVPSFLREGLWLRAKSEMRSPTTEQPWRA
jgi:hypothetical protein